MSPKLLWSWHLRPVCNSHLLAQRFYLQPLSPNLCSTTSSNKIHVCVHDGHQVSGQPGWLSACSLLPELITHVNAKIPHAIHFTSKLQCMTELFIKNLDRWRLDNYSIVLYSDAAMDGFFSKTNGLNSLIWNCCWTNIVSTLLLLGIRSLNILSISLSSKH
jgi:hypothetical protein